MSDFMHRALLAITVTAGLSACVPTTTTSTSSTAPVVSPASVPAKDVYLATADNGFAVPAVPAEKVPDEFERQVVDYPSTEAPGTVVINPASKHLYFITGNNKAIRYGIAVGAAGFQWSGEASVTNRRPWPTWTPPKEMIERKPELSKWEKGQPGGPTNPLGARALYLTTDGVDYGYRIHGTPDWWSIGKNASSGCIRMINQDVMDLYARVPDGAKVIVLTADGRLPKGLSLPPPAPVKKKPAKPAPAVVKAEDAAALPVPAAVTAPMTGPMSAAAPVTDPAAPLPAASAGPALSGTPPSVDPVAPAAPAAPAAVTAPIMTAPPSPSVTPAPADAPATPACAVPLVNGVCPKA